MLGALSPFFLAIQAIYYMLPAAIQIMIIGFFGVIVAIALLRMII